MNTEKKKKTRVRRSRLELYYNILKYYNSIKEQPPNRNQIINYLSITFAQLNEYNLTLQEVGLLEIDHNDNTIKITFQGVEFIRKFDYLTQQLKDNEKRKTK